MMIKILLCTFFCASALTIKEEVPVGKKAAPLKKAAKSIELREKTSQSAAALSESAVMTEGSAWLRKKFAGFDETQLKFAQNSGFKELVLEVFNDTIVQHAGSQWYAKQDAGYQLRSNKVIREALLQDDVTGAMKKGLFPKGFSSDPATKEFTDAIIAAVARHPEHISTMKSAFIESHHAAKSGAPIDYKDDPSKALGVIVALAFGMVVAPYETPVAIVFSTGLVVQFAAFGVVACIMAEAQGKGEQFFVECVKQVVTGRWAYDSNANEARTAMGGAEIAKEYEALNAAVGSQWWVGVNAGIARRMGQLPTSFQDVWKGLQFQINWGDLKNMAKNGPFR